MTQENTINDDQPGAAEPTLEEEIAQMVGASDAATAEALAQEGFELPPDPLGEEGSDAPAPDAEPATSTEPALAPTPTDVESDQMALLRTENARLLRVQEEQAGRSVQQALEMQAQQGAIQYAAQLVSQGWDEKQAEQQAESERKRYIVEQTNVRQSDALFKSNLAQELSISHGVPVTTLMGAKTESEMRSLAVSNIKTPREVVLEAENAALKKTQVPAQNYSSTPNRVAASSEQRNLDLYNRGVRTEATEAAGKRAAGF